MHDHEELISPQRYFLSHCTRNFRHRVRYVCLGISHQPQSQGQGLLLIPLNDLDPASPKKPHFPLLRAGIPGAAGVCTGGRLWRGSADSWLCSARGPWQHNHFSPPFTKAWLWHSPGGDLLLVHQGFPRWECCCPVRSQTRWISFSGHTQHIQGIPGALGLLLLAETQLICIYSMTMSGKTGCVKPRHNFQAWKRACSETSDIF